MDGRVWLLLAMGACGSEVRPVPTAPAPGGPLASCPARFADRCYPTAAEACAVAACDREGLTCVSEGDSIRCGASDWEEPPR